MLDAEAEGFDCEPLKEKLRELLHPDRDTLHLLVPDSCRGTVMEALANSKGTSHPLELRHERAVTGARFHFTLKVYSKEHGEAIRTLFEQLPEGARLTPDSDLQVMLDPSAEGVELYAPTHDFELRGKGTIEGDLMPVLEVYRKCVEELLIHQEKAHLVTE